MPGSPLTSTTRPSPAFARCHWRASNSTYSSRPTSGVASERNASKRLKTPLSPTTRQARCGFGKTGERLRPEILEFEQGADLPTCALGKDERARRGQRLQLAAKLSSVPLAAVQHPMLPQLAHNGSDPDLNPSLSASTECLAEGLRDSNIRCGGASVHHLSDIAVDLVHIDHADSCFCR